MLYNDSNSSSIQRYAYLLFGSCTAAISSRHCALIHDHWLKHVLHRSQVSVCAAPSDHDDMNKCTEDKNPVQSLTLTNSRTHSCTHALSHTHTHTHTHRQLGSGLCPLSACHFHINYINVVFLDWWYCYRFHTLYLTEERRNKSLHHSTAPPLSPQIDWYMHLFSLLKTCLIF